MDRLILDPSKLYYINTRMANYLGIRKNSLLWPNDHKHPISTVNMFHGIVANKANYYMWDKRLGTIDAETAIYFGVPESYHENLNYFKCYNYITHKVHEISVQCIIDDVNKVSEELYDSARFIHSQLVKSSKFLDINLTYGRYLPRISCLFSTISDLFSPTEMGLKYYMKNFRKVVITLLCIQKYHYNWLDKQVWLMIINHMAKDPYVIDISNIQIMFVNTEREFHSIIKDNKSLEDFENADIEARKKFKKSAKIVTDLVQGRITINEAKLLIDFPPSSLPETLIFNELAKPRYLNPKYAYLFDIKKGDPLWPAYCPNPICDKRMVIKLTEDFINKRIHAPQEFPLKETKCLVNQEIISRKILLNHEPLFITNDTEEALSKRNSEIIFSNLRSLPQTD